MGYYRGDYYRGRGGRSAGDYYRGMQRGDPFWGALLRGITTVGRAVLGLPAAAPTAASAAAGAATTAGVAGRAATVGRIASTTLPAVIGAVRPPSVSIPPMVRTAGATLMRGARSPVGQMVAAGTIVEVGGRLFDSATGAPLRKRYRRMNPANTKALRRSLRRVAAFGRLCSSARTAVGKAATQLQYGGRRRRRAA